jgi:iron complex outermembrane receptor protein
MTHREWAGVLAVACCCGSAAFAATPAPGGDELQEIIVTAERVSNAESKTPVSMEVIDQKDLQRKGIVDLQALAQADPSVNFDAGNGNGYITMRGVSGQGGIGPAVPVAFDGFYYNLPIIFNNALYDVNRVEVLRGPQGTLFGRNASGGLINVVTNDPGKEFGGYGQLTLGNHAQVNMEGALNIPLSDAVQLRFAYASAQHAGYRQLAAGSGVADDEDSKGGRVKLAVQATDHLAFLLSFQYTHVGGAGTADTIMNLPADANSFPTHEAIPLTHYMTEVYNVGLASQVNLDDKLLQLKATYDNLPGGITLSYLGGFDAMDYLHISPTGGLDAPNYGIPVTVELLSTQDPRTQNQELRLASAPGKTVTWQAGLYYFRSHIANNDTHFRDAATPADPDIVTFPYDNEQWSTAGYGQLGWHLGPTILSLGARYTKEHVGQTDLASPGDGIFPALQTTDYSKWTWHVGEEWNATDHNLLYAKVDTGFRAGAFNLNVPCNCTGGPPLPTTIVPYDPEYVTAYEIGSKNRMGGHLQVNADAFYMDYKGQQITASNQGGVYTLNARATTIYGVEAQLVALANAIGRFDLNATWLHARFADQVQTNALNQIFQIGGNHLIQSPDFSITAGFEHGFPLANGTLTARVETKYQSGQYFDFYNVPDSYQKAFTRSEAHLSYAPQAGAWMIDAFVRNIENAIVIVDESESFAPPLSQPGTYNVGFQAPRTYGVMLSAHF